MNKPNCFIAQNFRFLDLMPVGAFIVNQEYEVQYWNSCLERWSEIPKETILGTSLLEHFPRLQQAKYANRIEGIFNGGPPVVFSSKFHQYLIPCPIGNDKHQIQQTMVTPVHDDEENIGYALFTLRNVTDVTNQLANFKSIKNDLLKKEIELENVLLEVKRINHELEEFAYVVSHDLKAPLRGIKYLADWIMESLEDKVTDESKENLQMLMERVVRMQDMIDAILNYSKNISGELKVEIVDSKALVKEIIEEICPPPSFHFRIHPDLPQFYTHRTRLKQVFSNLLSNAFKHHDREDGKVEIGVSQEDDMYEFTVKDDGPGI